MPDNAKLPLVYACSGCSDVAQIANHVAVRLDRSGEAQMSCIAGVGGDVPALVRVARSGRPVVAIDGCKLACVENSLARHGVRPTHHYRLWALGLKKQMKRDFAPEEADAVYRHIVADLNARRTDDAATTSGSDEARRRAQQESETGG